MVLSYLMCFITVDRNSVIYVPVLEPLMIMMIDVRIHQS
jgi:hypothetical protein